MLMVTAMVMRNAVSGPMKSMKPHYWLHAEEEKVLLPLLPQDGP
jgi:hypothetical protein